jgi:hypothetical protein
MIDFTSMIIGLHKKYIKGSEKNAIVQIVQAFMCNLTAAVVNGISCPSNKVYISTRVLKHVYDKRPAEEFDFLIENLHLIIKFPDLIFKNKSGKRGEFCFVKEIKGKKYLCSIEIINKVDIVQCEIATFFRVDSDYLKNYELLWEWKGGGLHRSAFDADITQPNSTLQ